MQHQMSLSEDETIFRDSTPYRLPKIRQQLAQSRSPGTESEPIIMETHLSQRNKPPGPPYTISQLHRQEGIHMPTFQRVHIEPVLPCNRVADASEDVELEQSTSRTSLSPGDTVISGLAKHVTGTQQESTARTVDRHSAWRLSPHKHTNYDLQAIQGSTGPFSRDFVVHCNTPNSWLQMKLKRQKTSHR